MKPSCAPLPYRRCVNRTVFFLPRIQRSSRISTMEHLLLHFFLQGTRCTCHTAEVFTRLDLNQHLGTGRNRTHLTRWRKTSCVAGSGWVSCISHSCNTNDFLTKNLHFIHLIIISISLKLFILIRAPAGPTSIIKCSNATLMSVRIYWCPN